VISIEVLAESDEFRLEHILSEALGNAELVNQFAGCLMPLCEDPSEEALAIQDRLCRVVASQLRALGGDDLFDNVEKLRQLSIVADTILMSTEVNPRGKHGNGLQELLRAGVCLLSQLDEDRSAILDPENRRALGSELPPTALNDWMGLYVHGMDQVLLGFKIPGFEPSAELRSECHDLVAAQLSWTEAGMGPTDSTTSLEGQLWCETLGFARVVVDQSVDSALEDQLREVTQSLVRWFNEGALSSANAAIREEQLDGDEMSNMLGFLELAEHRAMSALLRAQSDCGVEAVWKEVLEHRSLSSRAARVALHGMVRAEVTEAVQHISKLLNRIGSDKTSPSTVKRCLDTLVVIAAEPGVAEVIVDSWGPDAEHPVDPLRKELLLTRVEERLERHYRNVGPALQRIQQCGEDSVSRRIIENRASKRGVIWSKRALATLEHIGT
jgi:hypothetical protein